MNSQTGDGYAEVERRWKAMNLDRLVEEARDAIDRIAELVNYSEWEPMDIFMATGMVKDALRDMADEFYSSPSWKMRGGDKYRRLGQDMDPIDD